MVCNNGRKLLYHLVVGILISSGSCYCFFVFDCFVGGDCGGGVVLMHACDICDAGREQERQR